MYTREIPISRETTESFTKRSKSDPAVSLIPRNRNFSNDYLDFLGEYEAICETNLPLK
jgi:hypothetical protein